MAPLEHAAEKASYRRGTIMGLTAAEAFMLICFTLLMLLLLWRVTAEQALDFSSNFTPEEKKISLELKGRLAEKNLAIQDIVKILPLLETLGMTPEKLVTAIKIRESLGTLDPELLDDRLRLVATEDIRRAVKAIQKVDKKKLLDLVDLIEDGKVRELVESPEMLKRLEAYEKTGLTAEQVLAIANALENAKAAGADIAQTLRDRVGTKIKHLGGRILDSGDVVFPDRLLFRPDSVEIEPGFDELLQAFCRPWFQVLYDERASLDMDAIRIEGHASSEYGDLEVRPAFDRNLDLSQGRAASVLRKCLDYGGSDEIASWARANAAAVGYSSSRLIIDKTTGLEDRLASRRVVFAIDIRSEEGVISRTLPGPTGGQ